MSQSSAVQAHYTLEEMNIPDKENLYQGIHRVLKKDGQLAIYDVLKDEHEPVLYPVPWAFEAAISFLVSPSGMR